MFFRFRKESDGGGPGDVNNDGGPANTDTRDNDGGPANTDGGGPANTDVPEIPVFATLDEANAYIPKLFEEHFEVSSKLKDITPKYDDLNKRVGHQANQLSDYNKIKKGLKDDATALIKSMAEEAGVKINFEDSKPSADLDTVKALFAGSTEDVAKGVEKIAEMIEAKAQEKVDGKVTPVVDMMIDNKLSQKYKDYDDFAEVREDIQLKVTTNVMSKKEVLHMAARATKLEEYGKAQQTIGYEKAKTEFKEKFADQLGDTGGNMDIKTDKPSNKQILSGVLNKLEKANI